ncbi:MAG: PTS galactitol transporter subunit IIC [Eubacteriales bacterium]
MEILATIFQGILDTGAAVFLPIVLFIIGIIVKMKPSKAFSAGLTLGVAFVGISMVTAFISETVGAAGTAFVQNTGINLTALDMGWAPSLGLAWSWKYAFLMFPIQIGINVIMLLFGWTDTLNVDMWNVANKICTGFLVYVISGSMVLGFAIAAVEVVLELKNADATKKQFYQTTGIPGCSMPHPMFLSNIIFYPLVQILDKIFPTKQRYNIANLKEKIGIFAENHVMGFIVGTFIGLMGQYSIQEAVLLGVQAGAALTVLPLVSQLFMTALAPISDATNKWVKSKFPGKEIVIGLDWPVLAGNPEIWVTIILTIPVAILTAMVLPGNIVLPFGNLLSVCVPAALFMSTQGDLIKMLILSFISVPILFWSASYFAPVFTELAAQTGGLESLGIVGDNMLAWWGMDIAEIRWLVCKAIEFNPIALVGMVGFIALTWYYFKEMKKKEDSIVIK